MTKFIKVSEKKNRVTIKLDNPPVNSETICMLEEIYNEVLRIRNSIIIFTGHQVTSKGRHVFSAGGDLNEIRQGKTFDIAKLINLITAYLNKSDNYVVSIICGDTIGGGWGMPFDMSDQIYFIKDASLAAGFTRNDILPGCGLSLLVKCLSPSGSYHFIQGEKFLRFDTLQDKCCGIFKKFEKLEDVVNIVANLKKGNKKAPYSAEGRKLKQTDNLAQLINELIEHPEDYKKIQLKYLKMSLDHNV